MTHYLVPVAEPVLREAAFWQSVDGFRLHWVADSDWAGHPGVRLCEFDDDDAGPEFAGKIVEPVIVTEYDTAGNLVRHRVVSRTVIG